MIKKLSSTQFNRIFNIRSNYRFYKFNEPIEAYKRLEDTSFKTNIIINADSNGFQFDQDDDRPERMMKAMFYAIAAYLSKRKVSEPDTAVALTLYDGNNEFRLAAIVEYSMNEENPDEPGNWSLSMTFNENDLKELEESKTVRIFSMNDPAFKSIYDKVAKDVGGFQFPRETYMWDACLLIIDTLIQTLDSEAIAGETVDLDFDGYFVASVSIENDHKIMTIMPSEHMKVIIKDDTILDKE